MYDNVNNSIVKLLFHGQNNILMPVVVATQTMKHCLSVYTDPKNNIVFISEER